MAVYALKHRIMSPICSALDPRANILVQAVRGLSFHGYDAASDFQEMLTTDKPLSEEYLRALEDYCKQVDITVRQIE